MEKFSDIETSITLPSEILWLFLAIGIILFFIFTFILQHHWQYYGIKDNPKIFARSIYWIISVFLILIMLVSILFFENI